MNKAFNLVKVAYAVADAAWQKSGYFGVSVCGVIFACAVFYSF